MKRTLPNAGYAIGDGESPVLSPWILNKHCHGFVVQHAILTAVNGIAQINYYAGQSAAMPNAPSPMLVTLLGMVTLVKCMQR